MRNVFPVITKILISDRVKLENIATRFNMSLYEFIQSSLITILNNYDANNKIDGNPLFLMLLNNIKLFNNTLNILSIKGKKEITSIILFNKQKTQIYLAFYKDGNFVINNDVDKMLELFLSAIDKNFLNTIKNESKKDGKNSIFQTLHDIYLCKKYNFDNIAEDIKNIFSDCRTEYGEKVNNDIYYKRKHNRFNESMTRINKKHKAML